MKSFSLRFSGVGEEFELVNAFILHNVKRQSKINLIDFIKFSPRQGGITNPELIKISLWTIERIKLRFGECNRETTMKFFESRFKLCRVVSTGKKRKSETETGGVSLHFPDEVFIGENVIFLEEKRSK